MLNCIGEVDLSTIPSMYETDDMGIKDQDKIIYLHFYNDTSHWFVIESNGKDNFYGVVVPDVQQEKIDWRDIPLTELQFHDQNSAAIQYDDKWTPVKAGSVEIIKKVFSW